MTNQEIEEILKQITDCYGKESMPKYVVLGDGTVFLFKKEEDRYALCEQTTSLQKGIPTTEGQK
jgi:hypothetical protein